MLNDWRSSRSRVGWFLCLCVFLVCCQQLYPQVKSASVASKGNTVARAAWQDKFVKDDRAPVKIIEYFDYQCPFCARTVSALEEALRQYPGKVQIILRNMPLDIHPDSMLAHQAALAAGEQGKFWEMHALLFANQRKIKLNDLLEYARQLNLDLLRFQNRLESGYYKTTIEKDMAAAGKIGINATPTFFINDQKLVGAQTMERFKAAIEFALDPTKKIAISEPVVSFDFSHSPILGNAEAPIAIVEFSDLQCPFCARVVPTLQDLVRQYPGGVKWVFKNFPLSIHANAPLAHQAVLAAGEQGKFWEMHDLVFANQQAMTTSDLLAKARSLNLDMARFTADLESDKIKQWVEADKREGERINVDATPTFYINGKEYSGAMPLTQFKTIVEEEMTKDSVKASLDKVLESASNNQEISLGPAGAPVTLLWFSDLQSSLTMRAALQVRQLINAYPGKIRVIFKNRPLESHPAAMLLHQAALAANAQGKFWEMHDLIISNPQKAEMQDLIAYAQRLGLDVKRFQDELTNHKYLPEIEHDLWDAKLRAVLGTPVFFFNSVRMDGLQPEEIMNQAITTQLSAKSPSTSY